jgi:hypothetical protein
MMGEAGRCRVEKHFTIDQYIENIHTINRELLQVNSG